MNRWTVTRPQSLPSGWAFSRVLLVSRLHFTLVAVMTTLVVCASSVAQTNARQDPRPIGVPENVTTEERGREVLRVTIELVKHGNLRDTEFASKLFRLDIKPDIGITLTDSKLFPQGLVHAFSYSFLRVSTNTFSKGVEQFRVRDHHVSMMLDRDVVCLTLIDFLDGFNRELGVGRTIVPDGPGLPHHDVPLKKGWREAFSTHPGRSLYQGMRNGITAMASFPAGSGCASSIALRWLEPQSVR
jgi:hypothetical protein